MSRLALAPPTRGEAILAGNPTDEHADPSPTRGAIQRARGESMEHADHVNLLRDGVPGPGLWADLGAGAGAFTLALAELLGPDGRIIAVDRDARALDRLARLMAEHFPAVPTETRVADFTHPLALPPLDGIVMANALHFVRDKGPVLDLIGAALRPGGRLILIEYGTDQGNTWVPYPLSYPRWATLTERHGLVHTRLLARRPSRFLGEIYAALSLTPPATSTH